jgi:beta-phosphoglucomutase
MTSIDNEKGVIFDMDGVLIDSAAAHKQAWFELAEREGYPISDQIFTGIFGLQNPSILAILSGRQLPAAQIIEFSDWKEQRYRDIIAETVDLAPGGYRLLKQLKDAGFHLAIGSSAPKANIDLIINKLQLSKYFQAFVSSEDTTRGKPAPDTFLVAAVKLNLAPANCVVVEDAVHGVKAGKAAGMKVVALTTTTDRSNLHEADLIVNSLDDLKAEDFTRLLESPRL